MVKRQQNTSARHTRYALLPDIAVSGENGTITTVSVLSLPSADVPWRHRVVSASAKEYEIHCLAHPSGQCSGQRWQGRHSRCVPTPVLHIRALSVWPAVHGCIAGLLFMLLKRRYNAVLVRRVAARGLTWCLAPPL